RDPEGHSSGHSLRVSDRSTDPGPDSDPQGSAGNRAARLVMRGAFAFHVERRAASAGRGGIRIPDGETAAGDRVHEIDFGAFQIADADRVDEQPDAVRFEHLIARAAALFDHQSVLEPGTAAALHEDTKTTA